MLGDFNEWIGKMVSTELDRSYMFTHEYEMYEFNLGQTFNYYEMAALIGAGADIVEFGAGASRKVRVLLDALAAPRR